MCYTALKSQPNIPVEKPAARTERAALPEWARKGCKWTLGSELEQGDTVYFSAIANPRQLVEMVRPGLWLGAVVVPNYYGREKHIFGQDVSVDPRRWYVVRRAAR
jgi:hypothetical protein